MTAPRGFNRTFDQSRDFFADRRTHRTADKRHIHRACVNQMSADCSFAGNDGFGQTRRFFRRFDALDIRFCVNEAERIGARYFLVELFVIAVRQTKCRDARARKSENDNRNACRLAAIRAARAGKARCRIRDI
jgi:hypothetical protein